jgi:uncharacterized membrane protein
MGFIAIPLMAVLGTALLWGILPFVIFAIGGLYMAIQHNYRQGDLLEELTFWDDRLELVRHNPGGTRQEWQANPYWVKVSLHEEGGPVPFYITLSGSGREVEIGAFLSEDERRALFGELQTALRNRGQPMQS